MASNFNPRFVTTLAPVLTQISAKFPDKLADHPIPSNYKRGRSCASRFFSPGEDISWKKRGSHYNISIPGARSRMIRPHCCAFPLPFQFHERMRSKKDMNNIKSGERKPHMHAQLRGNARRVLSLPHLASSCPHYVPGGISWSSWVPRLSHSHLR